MQQKLFLTTERLLLGTMDTVTDIERNQTNTWAVNYEVGIYELFIEQNTWLKCKKTLENRFYPFVDEFELEVVVKLLQRVGEGLGERSLNMYLNMLKDMDEIVRVIPPTPVAVQNPSHALVPTPETRKKSKFNQKYIPPTTPTTSSLGLSSQQFYNEYSPLAPSSLLTPAGQLPPSYRPSRIPDRKSPLKSFSDLKGLFKVFDKIKRGSYAAARLVEAYAGVIVNEACIDCWAKHNIIDDDNDGGDDTSFVDPFPLPLAVQRQPADPIRRVDKHMGVSSRPPLVELGNNVRSESRRSREGEDELERRWREREKKREAARSRAKTVEQVKTLRSGEGGSHEIELIVID